MWQGGLHQGGLIIQVNDVDRLACPRCRQIGLIIRVKYDYIRQCTVYYSLLHVYNAQKTASICLGFGYPEQGTVPLPLFVGGSSARAAMPTLV